MPKRPSFKEACRFYPNRYTMEHIPDWARKRPCDYGGTETRYYAPQYRTDREWYDNTLFPGESKLAGRSYCHTTNESWPLGTWLDEPYTRNT